MWAGERVQWPWLVVDRWCVEDVDPSVVETVESAVRVVGKTVDLHASGLPRCVNAGSEASSNCVELESSRGRESGCLGWLGGARRHGVGHADGGRDDLLINDRQYVGRGSALVNSVDESLLCVDKRLELAH